eukprot:978050-Ditylum_brightwellii.AAC.1
MEKQILTIQTYAGQCTYDTMEKFKIQLNAIKLGDYSEENVQYVIIAIKAKCDLLDNTKYWETVVLHVIVKKYKAT